MPPRRLRGLQRYAAQWPPLSSASRRSVGRRCRLPASRRRPPRGFAGVLRSLRSVRRRFALSGGRAARRSGAPPPAPRLASPPAAASGGSLPRGVRLAWAWPALPSAALAWVGGLLSLRPRLCPRGGGVRPSRGAPLVARRLRRRCGLRPCPRSSRGGAWAAATRPPVHAPAPPRLGGLALPPLPRLRSPALACRPPGEVAASPIKLQKKSLREPSAREGIEQNIFYFVQSTQLIKCRALLPCFYHA